MRRFILIACLLGLMEISDARLKEMGFTKFVRMTDRDGLEVRGHMQTPRATAQHYRYHPTNQSGPLSGP